MCLYITATLPPNANEVEVRRLVRGIGRGFSQIDCPCQSTLLQPGERHYDTTRGECDCSTSLGSCVDRPPRPSRKVSVLRKKGWGEAKIQRWLNQRQQIDERNERVRQHQAEAEGQSIWIELLRALFESGSTPWFGLVLHFYSSGPGVEEKPFELAARQVVRFEKVTPEFLVQIREDILYEVRP